jgi:hypothetical protein
MRKICALSWKNDLQVAPRGGNAICIRPGDAAVSAPESERGASSRRSAAARSRRVQASLGCPRLGARHGKPHEMRSREHGGQCSDGSGKHQIASGSSQKQGVNVQARETIKRAGNFVEGGRASWWIVEMNSSGSSAPSPRGVLERARRTTRRTPQHQWCAYGLDCTQIRRCEWRVSFPGRRRCSFRACIRS